MTCYKKYISGVKKLSRIFLYLLLIFTLFQTLSTNLLLAGKDEVLSSSNSTNQTSSYDEDSPEENTDQNVDTWPIKRFFLKNKMYLICTTVVLASVMLAVWARNRFNENLTSTEDEGNEASRQDNTEPYNFGHHNVEQYNNNKEGNAGQHKPRPHNFGGDDFEQHNNNNGEAEKNRLSQAILRKPVFKKCRDLKGRQVVGLLPFEERGSFKEILFKLNSNAVWDTCYFSIHEYEIEKLNLEDLKKLDLLLEFIDWRLKSGNNDNSDDDAAIKWNSYLQKARELVKRPIWDGLQGQSCTALKFSLRDDGQQEDFSALLKKMNISEDGDFRVSEGIIANRLDLNDIEKFSALIDSFEKAFTEENQQLIENNKKRIEKNKKRIEALLNSPEWEHIKTKTNEELDEFIENEKDKGFLLKNSGDKQLKDLSIEWVENLEDRHLDLLERVYKDLGKKIKAWDTEADKQLADNSARYDAQIAASQAQNNKQRKGNDSAPKGTKKSLGCPICLEEYRDLCKENEGYEVVSCCGHKEHHLCKGCYEDTKNAPKTVGIEQSKMCPICMKPLANTTPLYMRFIKRTGELVQSAP